MMNIQKIIIVSIISFITAIPVIAQEKDSGKAEAILFDAIKFTEKASLKATNPTLGKKSNKEKFILYRMTSPAGDLLEKYEQIINNKKYSLILRNKETLTWQEGANVAIKTPFSIIPRMARSAWYLNIPKFYKQITKGIYSISTDNYNGIPCYKVLVKYPTDDATIAKIQQITLKQLQQYRKACENRYMAVMTFLIGRDKPFIYSFVFYTMKGKALHRMNWGKLDLKTPVTQKDFELPRGTSIKVAKTRDELKILSKKYFTSSSKGK
jgi:hypothetical protein